MLRRTKIVCTIGPASANPQTLVAMIRAGMDVARLNASHGTMDEHTAMIGLIRAAAAEMKKPVAILMDLSGPKLRTGTTAGDRPLQLVDGATIRLTNAQVAGTEQRVHVEYPNLLTDISAGEPVLIDDGNIELRVTAAGPDGLDCLVVHGGALGAHKGVSFPQSNLTTPALTDRDKEWAAFGVSTGVDIFALSFVRDAGDIERARELLHSLGADTPIVAKIERRQAVENLDAILAKADGAMVARGDLGVELPPEEVPVQQRRIIASAAWHRIPVITATQMLESMVDSPRPTRAESSDVAHAVWELSDALMLSGETAAGRYPVETVAMMDRIIRRAELETTAPEIESLLGLISPQTDGPTHDHSHVLALAVRRIVESDANMKGVVCFTGSGYTAFLMSKAHPAVPIFAISPSETVCRRLALARGVVPLQGPEISTSEQMLQAVDDILIADGYLQRGDEVVVVANLPVGAAGATNFLKLHTLGESDSYRGVDL